MSSNRISLVIMAAQLFNSAEFSSWKDLLRYTACLCVYVFQQLSRNNLCMFYFIHLFLTFSFIGPNRVSHHLSGLCILAKIFNLVGHTWDKLWLFFWKFVCVCALLTGYSNTVCSTFLLVPLVKGPLVQLTLPGLCLCPLFTGTVTRLMEAETKGGLFLLSCPGLSALLWAQTELRAGGCLKRGHLTSPDLQKGHENETMRKSKESEKERKMYSYNPEPFKSSVGNCCYVNTCSH